MTSQIRMAQMTQTTEPEMPTSPEPSATKPMTEVEMIHANLKGVSGVMPTYPLPNGAVWTRMEDIQRPRMLQIRDSETIWTVVESYRIMSMHSPLTMPPVDIYRYDSVLHLANGWQRYAAAKAIGWAWLPAFVVDGTERDATIHSALANVGGVEPLKPEEKARAYLVLAFADSSVYTPTYLAGKFGVSDQTVTNKINAQRARVALAQTGMDAESVNAIEKRVKESVLTAAGHAENVTPMEVKAILERAVALNATREGTVAAFASANKLDPGVRAGVVRGKWAEAGFLTGATIEPPATTQTPPSPAQQMATATNKILAAPVAPAAPAAPAAPVGDAATHARLPVESLTSAIRSYLHGEDFEPFEAAAMGMSGDVIHQLAGLLFAASKTLRS